MFIESTHAFPKEVYNLKEDLVSIINVLNEVDNTQVKYESIQDTNVQVIGNTSTAYVRMYHPNNSNQLFIDIIDVVNNRSYNICRKFKG